MFVIRERLYAHPVEINHTICTQLDNNEWLYVAPKSSVVTVLCSKHKPRILSYLELENYS